MEGKKWEITKREEEEKESVGVEKRWILAKSQNVVSPSLVSTGRNKYCIDKNYGGILIIWDRLFGK